MFILLPIHILSRTFVSKAATAFKALSDDASIQYILADIPFFAVGLLAFGIYTFFLVMHRANRVISCLHFAVFMGFTAAILDLSQNLVRGRVATDTGQDVDSVRGLIIAREVCFALSFGLRFLFFLGLVAEGPRGEHASEFTGMHSGSWGRWGVIGFTLKWTLANLCVAITILQILYRNVTELNKIGPVYEVESTIEIIASAVFILKLLLNTYLAAISPRRVGSMWRVLRNYSPIIIALLINMGIGIGNIIQFLFSETVLGRFLQAVEFYILILYVVISAFYHLRHFPSPAAPSHPLNRSSSFRGLPPMGEQESFFQITPPHVSTPDLMTILRGRRPSQKSQSQSQTEKSLRPSLPNPQRGSTASRISTWLVPRRISGRISTPFSPNSPDTDRLWNQDEAEQGLSPNTVTGTPTDVEMKASRNSLDQSPIEPKESAKWQDPMFTTVLKESELANDLYNVSVRPPPALSPITRPPRVFSRPITPVSAGSTESPIFGLNGIIRSRLSPLSPSEYDDPSFLDVSRSNLNDKRASSISHLLRQQAELDKSIASLKLLSRPTDTSADRDSRDSDVKPPSASQSEFSLSNFPEPPWGRASVDADLAVRAAALPVVTVQQAGEASSPNSPQISSRVEPLFEMILPQMPAAASEHNRNISVPFSDDGNAEATGSRSRIDSEGTQYEITSFIGNLTQPGRKEGDSSSASQSSTAMTPDISPRIQRTALRSDASPPSGPVPSFPLQNPPLVILSSVPPRLASGARRGILAGPSLKSKRPVGLPPRPRLAVGSNLGPLVERATPVDEYERPRPAPSPNSRELFP